MRAAGAHRVGERWRKLHWNPRPVLPMLGAAFDRCQASPLTNNASKAQASFQRAVHASANNATVTRWHSFTTDRIKAVAAEACHNHPPGLPGLWHTGVFARCGYCLPPAGYRP
mmetsp:Transcript_89721/g.290321  ORF Transcript_89721/g.290321 Transcript_89721/m.290321 type:complete len:113 (-) Transcript_89721:1611-1949(-)